MVLDRQSAAVANSVHSPRKKLRIGFVHPDLGIGGAEKLIVDAAVSLQQLGHEVVIFTSYHDPRHCFEATRDGTLKVQVMRTCIPRSVFGWFHLPCAILQQMSLVFQLILSILLFNFPGTLPRFISRRLTSSPPIPGFDLFFFDQLTAGIPWLKILLATAWCTTVISRTRTSATRSPCKRRMLVANRVPRYSASSTGCRSTCSKKGRPTTRIRSWSTRNSHRRSSSSRSSV